MSKTRIGALSMPAINKALAQVEAYAIAGMNSGGGSDVTLPISATDVTETSTLKWFTATEKTKLAGINSTGTNTGDETFTRLNTLSGNLNDNKLSANIPLKNALNTFSQKQTLNSGAYVAGLLETENTSVYNGGNLIAYNVGTTVPTFTVVGATGYVDAGGAVTARLGFKASNPSNGVDQIIIGGNNLGYMAGYSSTGVIGWAMYAEYKVITAMSGGSLTANAPDNTVANVALNGTTGNIDMNGFINMKDTVNGNMYKIAMVSGVLTVTPV